MGKNLKEGSYDLLVDRPSGENMCQDADQSVLTPKRSITNSTKVIICDVRKLVIIV